MNSRGVRQMFLPLGGRGSETICSFEHSIHLQRIEPPLQPMENVPGTDTVNIVVDGGSRIQASEAGDKGRDDVLASRSPLIFQQTPDVAVHMVDEDPCTVCLPSGVSPRIQHDLKNTTQVILQRRGMMTENVK